MVSNRIYTEENTPYSIKYLKVLKTETASKYTLYGNTQDNNFECIGDKECEMYGHSYSTSPGINKNIKGDSFALDFDSNNYTIKDFRSYEEPDRIEIPLKDSEIIYPDPNVDIGNEPVLEIVKLGGMFAEDKKVSVTIEGFTREEIRGWVEVVKNPKDFQKTDIENNHIITPKLTEYLNKF